jgi:signal-transduction protein with cAMP-binding, CBS, and nucleotidyltransferase domain
MDLRETLAKPVTDYMATTFAKVPPGASVTEAARAMKELGATEAVVFEQEEVEGMVTERDILYKVVAVGLDPRQVKVMDVMNSPVETIGTGATVGDAIAKMSSLGMRRLGVESEGKFVGLVTQKNLASDKPATSAPLPELADPRSLQCPYCGARAKDVKDLSKHIDQAHVGLGLLEGDRTKW